MREIDTIIVHCSATPPDMDIGAEEIRRWHVEERRWSDIGYHYVIRRDGTLEPGRALELAGAHARGYNDRSIGICLVGGTDADDRRTAEANFTLAQYEELARLVGSLRHGIKIARVVGHRDLPGAKKACPCFDVRHLLGAAA